MTPTVDALMEQAMTLDAKDREQLAERIVQSIAHEVPIAIEQEHLEIVRRRQAEVASGKIKMIAGEEALAQVRAKFETA